MRDGGLKGTRPTRALVEPSDRLRHSGRESPNKHRENRAYWHESSVVRRTVGMGKDELDYAKMKEFLSFYAERYLRADGLPPDKQPIASLKALEKKSMKMAFNGLRQAINNCVEASLHFDHAEVEKLDSQLRSRSIVTLSELRRRYSKSYAKIVKRGQIENETEYYLVRNILYDPTEKAPDELQLLQRLISDYEAAV